MADDKPEEGRAQEEEKGEGRAIAAEESIDGGKKEGKKSIASRGIPSQDSLYLPPHNSLELRAFQDSGENPTRNAWSLEEVANFVFPRRYQEKYNEVALAFLRLLVGKNSLSGEQIGSFVSSQGVSKATFYNRVLPRLKRIGMLKVERQTVIALESKRKFRPMSISLSRTFGNYLTKIGDSWLAIVDDARSKRQQEKRAEK